MESLTILNTSLPSLFQTVVNENPKPVPAPPQDLVEYRLLSKFEQFKVSEKFNQQEHIKNYLEDKWKVELYNRDCFIWLWEVYAGKWKVELDDKKKEILEIKMSQFKKAIMKQDRTYIALKLNFDKFPFKDSSVINPAEVAWND